jgi:hypothetical protein
MTEIETTRAFLVEDLRRQAEWREGKAAEYPEDDRNARAAKTLRHLAALLEQEDLSNADKARLDKLALLAKGEPHERLSTRDASALRLWNRSPGGQPLPEPTLGETLDRIIEETAAQEAELAAEAWEYEEDA